MATTFPIPLTTLTVGSHDFGPTSVADGDTLAAIMIDRTVPGGFNSLTAATQMVITIYQSNDSGATWNELAEATVPGGVYVKNGVTAATSGVGVHFWPGTGRLVKGNLTVTGTSVAVQGTITAS